MTESTSNRRPSRGAWLRRNPSHPGQAIRDDCMEGMTVGEAARQLGVARVTLSRVLNGQSGITPSLALKLEEQGWSTAQAWMWLQMNYDLAQERDRIVDRFAEHSIDTLTNLIKKVDSFCQEYGYRPCDASIYTKDFHTNSDLAVQVWSSGRLLAVLIDEHLTSLATLIRHKDNSITACVVARSLLEPCSLVCWLFDPNISSEMRFSRALSFRERSIQGQLGLAQKDKSISTESRKKTLAELNQRMTSIRQENSSLKCPWQKLKDSTQLIQKYLAMETDFGLLSCVEHPSPSTVLSLGFNTDTGIRLEEEYGGFDGQIVYRSTKIETVYIPCSAAIRAFIKAKISMFHYAGWDAKRLDNLTNRYDSAFHSIQQSAGTS
jgi:addiction module HigA family antidote